MIRLSGKDESQIPIDVHRRRAPGEKMHEVLWNDDEAVGPTSHPKIMRAARAPIDARVARRTSSRSSSGCVDEGDTLGVVARLGAIVREPVRTRRATPSSKTRCTEFQLTRHSSVRRRGYGGVGGRSSTG